MKITTTYTSETRAEAKALRMMALNLQGIGLDLSLAEGDEKPPTVSLTVSEHRRKRRSSQDVAEDALSSGEAHP